LGPDGNPILCLGLSVHNAFQFTPNPLMLGQDVYMSLDMTVPWPKEEPIQPEEAANYAE